MMNNFQGWAGASMWSMAILDVLLIICAVWIIYRAFAILGTGLLKEDKQRNDNRLQAIQPLIGAKKR